MLACSAIAATTVSLLTGKILSCRYSDEDLHAIWRSAVCTTPSAYSALQQASSHPEDLLGKATAAVFNLRDIVTSIKAAGDSFQLSIRHLLRVVEFVGNHAPGLGTHTFTQNLVLGCRFLVADALQQSSYTPSVTDDAATSGPSELTRCAEEWWPTVQHLLGLQDRAWFRSVFEASTKAQCTQALRVLDGAGAIQCAYAGLIAVTAPRDTAAADGPALAELLYSTQMTFTPTMLVNVARIMASQVSNAPLLLEGPPGIGKSFVVGEMAKLMRQHCERINFASSTTLEQLLGSTIPRYIDGEVSFEWRDGTLTQALVEVSYVMHAVVREAHSSDPILPFLRVTGSCWTRLTWPAQRFSME